MLKLSLLGAIAAIAAVLVVPVAPAGAPDRVIAVDDIHFQSGVLTAACGTDVFLDIEGIVRIILRTDRNGVLYETDAFTNWAVTFSAPDLGTSVSYKFGPAIYEYPDGVYIGAPSTVTFFGLDNKIPGIHGSAGRTVAEGEVVDIRPDGVPVVEPFTTISQVGNQITQLEFRTAICAALTG